MGKMRNAYKILVGKDGR